MLTMADNGGGGAGLDTLFVADIICEQPFTVSKNNGDMQYFLKKEPTRRGNSL